MPMLMFERFAEEARHTLAFAHEEAMKLGHGHVQTAHLLLGIFRSDPHGSARLLTDARISADEVREELRAHISSNSGVSEGKIIEQASYSKAAQRVVELAA